jgi:hypothetical protein
MKGLKKKEPTKESHHLSPLCTCLSLITTLKMNYHHPNLCSSINKTMFKDNSSTMIIGTHLYEPSIGSISGHQCNNSKCGLLDISIEWNGMEQCLL